MSHSMLASIMIVILVLSIAPIRFLDFGHFSLPTTSAQQSDWMKGPSMPVARSDGTGAALIGKLYIIGGFDNRGQRTAAVEVYDPITDKWSTSAPLPQPLDHAAAASYDGRLYVVGGGYLNRDNLSDKLFIYDPKTNAWTEGAKLPTARGALTANFINGTLYAVGGVDNSGASSSNLVYDPKTNAWTEKAPMPTAREHLTSAVVDDKLYVIGGRQTDNDSPKANINQVEMYNPLNDSWTIMEQMPTKRSGIAAAVSPIDNNIYVFGGENPFRDEGPIRAFDIVEKYNPKTNTWTTGQAMPTARHGLAASTIDDKIYVVSGGIKAGRSVSNVNEVLVLNQNKSE
jgi:N-acetylneuraminic acid mutarotase